MEELNEETLEQVNEAATDVPVDDVEIEEAVELPVDDDDEPEADDVDDEDEDEDEDEAAAEPAEQPDRKHDALRKFAEAHQLLSVFHQRATQQEYRDRGRILGLLNLKDGIETKDMTQVLGIRRSDLFAALDKLEAEGLIERVWGDEEKRWATISLSEQGRTAKIPSGRITDFAFEGLADEELDAFIASLERIMKNVETELGENAQKLLKEQRAAKPAGKPEEARGRGGKGGRDDRGRGGFRKHDDRGGRGGFRKHDDRDRDRDRGPRREDKGGFSRDNSKRGGGFGGRGGRGGFGGGRGGRGGFGGNR